MIEEVAPDFLLEDFGLSITAGAVSGMCILDQNSEIILNGSVVMVDYAATCRTDLFGNLQYGSGVAIDEMAYIVRHEPIRMADGKYCYIPLELLEIQNGNVPPAVIGASAADIPETVVIPEPLAGDDWPIWMTKYAVALTSVRAVISGSASPSATIQIVYDSDLTASGQQVIEELVVDNTTVTESAIIVNQPIPENVQVRLKVIAVSGSINHVTVYLRGVAA